MIILRYYGYLEIVARSWRWLVTNCVQIKALFVATADVAFVQGARLAARSDLTDVPVVRVVLVVGAVRDRGEVVVKVV